MLIQPVSISTLDIAAKARLMSVAKSLLTNEHTPGFIFFEGQYFKSQEVQALAAIQTRQFLAEGSQ